MTYSLMNYDQTRSEFYRYLTLDVSTYLQSIQGVTELKLEERYGCEMLSLLHWEQLHSVTLPDDVKNFYLATNGFELTWKFKLADHSYPVGKMHVNVLTELFPVNEPWKPAVPLNIISDKYDKNLVKIFVLDSNFSQGCVVLMLAKGSSSSTIHYLNGHGQLIQLAENLASYFRLMLLYLGLPDWPLAHLNMEPSYWNKQLYAHFAPYLSAARSKSTSSEESPQDQSSTTATAHRFCLFNEPLVRNVLDVSIFKTTKTPR